MEFHYLSECTIERSDSFIERHWFFLERLLTSENSSVSLTTSVKQFKCIVIIIIIMLNFKTESGITK